MIYEFQSIKPNIHETAFIAPSADIIGNVTIGKNSSIWFQTLVRGDVNYITIGENVNIQDMSVVHVARDKFPTIIGDNVSIGHRAIVHGCVLQKFSFVGMGAMLMDGVELGEYSFIAAGTLIPPGKKIPPGVLVMGSPGKIIRDITDEDREIITRTASNYSRYKDNYLKEKDFACKG
ncbi:MAG: gamma carbonic anhydrase family protein [Leptospiraceae bacterium]|nr:gamma carbonic anhydrase family protein [Leptospiraceae bacterium]MCK6381329.1 gamma carbonic anhydrase family protein [Leptospiraceae bacterium]NUM42850.1 gamma carbonic anhydrase family protein [Leptospiraceae bacterium]